jgi:catechol 2,3-dioxygenase-like lactoylglutathione lyase family enzyme
MARIVGLGGVFLKVADQDGWRAWYHRVLGFTFADWGGVVFPHPDMGVVAVAPFPTDTDYFSPSSAPFMINFIVDDLDGAIANVRAAGVEPIGREDNENGHFAWLMDPAGVKVELWQPL